MESITEKNSLEELNSRTEQAEKIIGELKDRSIEIIQSEEQKEKRMNKKENLGGAWVAQLLSICLQPRARSQRSGI